MRLLTHNMLASNIKGVTNGFPLRIEAEKVVEKDVDFNADFLKNIFSKIEWKPLVDAARSMGYADLPEDADPSMLASDEFLHKLHHALLQLHLEEGALICPVTGRRFPVNKGIPNMLLHEDEAHQTALFRFLQDLTRTVRQIPTRYAPVRHFILDYSHLLGETSYLELGASFPSVQLPDNNVRLTCVKHILLSQDQTLLLSMIWHELCLAQGVRLDANFPLPVLKYARLLLFVDMPFSLYHKITAIFDWLGCYTLVYFDCCKEIIHSSCVTWHC